MRSSKFRTSAIVSGLPALLFLVAACGSHAESSSVDSIDECASYLATYRACMSRLGPPLVTEQRVAGLRESLEARAHDPGGREAIKKTCVASQAQLSTACR